MKRCLVVLCLCGAVSTVRYTQSSAGGGSMSVDGSIRVVAGHSVTLTWTASTSSGVTVDSTVGAGQTYYYVTAVSQGSSHSSYSIRSVGSGSGPLSGSRSQLEPSGSRSAACRRSSLISTPRNRSEQNCLNLSEKTFPPGCS